MLWVTGDGRFHCVDELDEGDAILGTPVEALCGHGFYVSGHECEFETTMTDRKMRDLGKRRVCQKCFQTRR